MKVEGEVKVEEIVRQGTVFRPKLCCVSTQSVNDIGHSILSLITPEAGIGAPVYVDDVLGVGDVSTMEKVIDNTRKMEDMKKFKFSKKKSKYMVSVCICICSSKLHLSLRSILAAGALSCYMKARLELDHVISDLICTD